MDVKGPDGVVTRFPDGTDDATVDKVMSSIYRAPKAKVASKSGFIDSARAGIREAFNGVDRAANAGLEAIGVDTDKLNRAVGGATIGEATARVRADADNAGTGGRIIGNLIGTAPTAMFRGGAAVGGAASGAMLSRGETPLQVAGDAALGAGAAVVGGAAMSAAGRAISPRVNGLVARLQREGVSMTPGQILGGGFKRAEDVLTSVPVVGDMVRGAQRRSVDSFNRAAVNRVLQPLGQRLDDNTETGRDAVAFAGDQVRAAYRSVLPRVTATVDPAFARRVAVTQARAALPPAQAARFNEILQTQVANAFRNGRASGQRVKALEEQLNDFASGWRRADDPDIRALGQATSELRDHVLALIRRQNPSEAPLLRAANTAYANLVRVERAAANTADGVFSPKQLGTAVRQSDRSTRKRAVSRGEALMQDFSDAASQRLPGQVPDSGTPTRLLATLGAGGALGVDPLVLGAGGVLAAAYSRPGQAALRAGLTGRQGAAPQYLARLTASGARPVSIAAPTLLARARD